MNQATNWKSGWTAANPLDIKTMLTGKDDGTWVTGPAARYRDLGLAEATGDLLRARHVRGGVATGWQFHDLDFQWFFVLNGELEIRTEDGRELTLGKGASAYQPPFWRHQIHSVSEDYEAIEVTGPADFGTVTGQDAAKPARAAEFAHLKGIYTFDEPQEYVRGDGPRAWSLYRDLGTRTPTDGRVHIHIIKLDTEQPSPQGGTGEHHHTMAQWFMPIRGWIDISAEGQPDRRLHAGDFMMLQRGAAHNAFDASPDYMTLEFCVPADYETVAR
ncbi:cupin domain-containing protein [Amycolatopsis sp. GM8]|uniref:cupin domain-containing protein n=1 Tax=Amycolatopsis sp. GM8 TaxID=2896530 RepID=UPI001F20D657|nr:cupin domain-containing protein [Amycolatopsis sp. GM8]